MVIELIQITNIELEQADIMISNENDLIKKLYEKDKITSLHCMRVKNLSMQLGEKMGLSNRDIKILGKASLLHDVGKIAIDDSILNKPGELSKKEWGVMKKHPLYGELMIKDSELKDDVKKVGEIIRHHHEHYNGKGYPYGLGGEEIPFLARVISVVDVFDALISKRPYRDPFSIDEGVLILKELSGKQLDSSLTEIFIHDVLKL